MVGAFLAVALILGLGGAVYVARAIDPAWLLSAGIAADVFLARGSKLGIPISPSRLLLAAGSVALLARATEGGKRPLELKLRPIHWLLVGVVAWAVVSGLVSGSFRDHNAIWALADNLGAIPFWMFLIAPLAFATESQRRILLGTLIVLGGYLGVTALFETLHLNALVWPKYILDPRYGSHGDRARGPFVEAIANGLGLYACGVAAAIGMSVWRHPWVRRGCALVIGLCAAGCLFTLTREIWIGAAAGTLLALAGFAELRRYLLPAVAVGAVITLVSLAAIPGFSSSLSGRTHDDSSVWVRKNVARAAINMVNARPLLGFGWNNFQKDSLDYFRQADTYPLKGIGVPVHNVFLLTAVELGLVGATLWALALFLAVGAAIFDSGGPPELRPWRIGLLALFVEVLAVANFGPSTYPFPTLLLWTWAGLVGSRLTRPEPAPEPAVLPHRGPGPVPVPG
ncbi:MAG TPA: O-antigen ligase family protein [Thermoleophilaceae bacterium]|jgi:O-antigen ligase